ncbi:MULTISPECIES: type IX secretion/gliding motility protein PorT/SprT [Tenacibaculum]|uniref:type IX secretion/gliding motility protein PorT/SprT n=1 Tax=Tenacibaculum TaxID=104267 RepID=UPI001F0A0925|nr:MULTISPECIES: porin family protein [Tenacibaculum]MCH3881909.1 PorT family protein [Tenacibaculum aquimarinum]MDO6598522.1 porin family protein [Tenacibaculum sp. 1_MG-2023]
MKKQFIILGFLLLIISSAFAQKDRIENLPSFDKPRFHYGFYLGLNRNDFKLDYRPNSSTNNPNIVVEPSIGFNVGLIADYRLHKNINLRFEPGLMTNTKTITFNHVVGSDAQRIREDVGSTFLHMPLILKFSTDRLDNVRPYILGGLSFDHNFSSNEDQQDDNTSGEFRMKSSNFMYEVGIGIDIYLQYFKFSPSIRGVFAITDELKYDDASPSQWTDPINYMGTRGVFLHFAFE